MGRNTNEDWEQSDISAILAGIKRDGVISGLSVAESSPAAMSVKVEIGLCIIDGVVYSELSPQNVSISNGDATHPRKDIVVYDATAGAPVVCEGTPAAAPHPPDIPDGDIYLGMVFVAANETTSVENTDISEGRVFVDVKTVYTGVSANTTLNAAHDVVTVSASGGSRTITLPTAVGVQGKVYTIKKTDSSANTITIDGNGTETIDGNLTFILYKQYEAINIISDGSNWYRIMSAHSTTHDPSGTDMIYTAPLLIHTATYHAETGSWYGVNSGLFGHYIYNTPQQNGDEVSFRGPFTAGDWQCILYATHNTYMPIIDIKIGSTVIASPDLYYTTGMTVWTTTEAAVTVPTDADRITLLINGKNASSTGYLAYIQSVYAWKVI